MATETPRIESFILRFVEDAPDEWHGVIIHVQTNEDQSFANLGDAVTFMARYVDVLKLTSKREGNASHAVEGR